MNQFQVIDLNVTIVKLIIQRIMEDGIMLHIKMDMLEKFIGIIKMVPLGRQVTFIIVIKYVRIKLVTIKNVFYCNANQ